MKVFTKVLLRFYCGVAVVLLWFYYGFTKVCEGITKDLLRFY